jgi:hypothetical protein
MIAFSENLHRIRRRTALAAVSIALGLAVVSAHGGLVVHEPAMAPVDTVCLAVIGVAAAVAFLPASQSRAPAWLLTPAPRRPTDPLLARTVAPPARAGPSELQVFLS